MLDLESLLGAMEEGDRYHRDLVALIDPMARDRYLGRSILTRGDFATTH